MTENTSNTPLHLDPATPTPHFDIDGMRRAFEMENDSDEQELEDIYRGFSELMKEFDVWSQAYVVRRTTEIESQLEREAEEIARDEAKHQHSKESISAYVNNLLAHEPFR